MSGFFNGDRIELTVEDRGMPVLQVAPENRELTIPRLCDESVDFYTVAELPECRANPTRVFNRASLFDL